MMQLYKEECLQLWKFLQGSYQLEMTVPLEVTDFGWQIYKEKILQGNYQPRRTVPSKEAGGMWQIYKGQYLQGNFQ